MIKYVLIYGRALSFTVGPAKIVGPFDKISDAMRWHHANVEWDVECESIYVPVTPSQDSVGA